MIFQESYNLMPLFLLLLETKENISVAETLQKVWAILELNMEQYALSLLR